jgi:hypothetical protein
MERQRTFVPSLAWWATRAVVQHKTQHDDKDCTICNYSGATSYALERINIATKRFDVTKWICAATTHDGTDLLKARAIESWRHPQALTGKLRKARLKNTAVVKFIYGGDIITVEALTYKVRQPMGHSYIEQYLRWDGQLYYLARSPFETHCVCTELQVRDDSRMLARAFVMGGEESAEVYSVLLANDILRLRWIPINSIRHDPRGIRKVKVLWYERGEYMKLGHAECDRGYPLVWTRARW